MATPITQLALVAIGILAMAGTAPAVERIAADRARYHAPPDAIRHPARPLAPCTVVDLKHPLLASAIDLLVCYHPSKPNKGINMLKIVLGLFVALGATLAIADIPRFYRVDSLLYRSGALSQQTDVNSVRDAGIRTVISLETDPIAIARERAWAAQSHLNFISYPVSEITGPSVDTMHLLVGLIGSVEPPVLVHCRRGADRTGMVVGAYRILVQGWSADSAVREMRSLGHYPWLYWWDQRLDQM